MSFLDFFFDYTEECVERDEGLNCMCKIPLDDLNFTRSYRLLQLQNVFVILQELITNVLDVWIVNMKLILDSNKHWLVLFQSFWTKIKYFTFHIFYLNSWILQLRDVFVIHTQHASHVLDFACVSVKVRLDSNAVPNKPRDFVWQWQVARSEYATHFVFIELFIWGNWMQRNWIYVLSYGSTQKLEIFAGTMETQNKHPLGRG